MIPSRLPQVREALLAWYDANARDLPWRQRPGGSVNPYAVWVSEVMLQQTRVETVRPYFERWLQAFPDLESLAAASQDEVLKAWEGLGYYSRARNLHTAVREVVARYGAIPSDPEALRSLSGVGRYTAGAIASIAFGKEAPVVDGNVKRVFARLLDRADPTDVELWELASRLVVGERPGDLNQALMDLGATVCHPKSPACPSCPIREHCGARASGTAERTPSPKRRGRLPVEEHGVAVLRHDGLYLLVRRPETARLGGLWSFPAACRGEGEGLDAAARRAVEVLLPVPVPELAPIGQFYQVFTHVKVVYSIFAGTMKETGAIQSNLESGKPTSFDDMAWVAPTEFARFAMPHSQRRVTALLEVEPASGSPSP